MLEVKNLTKKYKSTTEELVVLDNINFKIEPGEVVSIIGPSGSGKTTLLGLCAGLDRATSGTVMLNDNDLGKMNEDQLAKLRSEQIGFIFQNFQLIPTLNAIENVLIPLELNGKSKSREIAKDLLDKVGLTDRYDHYPSQLSGGEQQRVAMARAFSNNPKILFADEPTGNLDRETGALVQKLLFDLNNEHHTTLVIVTHDNELAEKANHIVRLSGGKMLSELQ